MRSPLVAIFGLVLALLSLFLLYSIWKAYIWDTNIQKHGKSVLAQVAQKHYVETSAENAEYYYMVDYWFVLPDGQRLNSSRKVSLERGSKMNVGDSLVVFYDPHAPKRNFIEGEGVTSIWVQVIGSIILVFLTLAFGLLFLSGVRRKQ